LISVSIAMHVLEIYDTDELYRRIPEYWLRPNGTPSSAAFQNTTGTDDMSVDLARLTTPEETAAVMEDCGVASFYAILARRNEQEVHHTPTVENYAHSSVKGKKTKAIRRTLAKGSKIVVHPKSQ
jgi:hypothetical protein